MAAIADQAEVLLYFWSMPILHYGNSEIVLSNDESRGLEDHLHQSRPGLVSLDVTGGSIHLVIGPGIPIWIDRRTQVANEVMGL